MKYKESMKIKYLTKQFKILRSYTFIDWIQTIGGFLIMMNIPLFIGLIWFNPIVVIKIILTNAILIFGVRLVDLVEERRTK